MSILTANYENINYEEMAKAIGLKPKHMPMLIGSFLEESAPCIEALTSYISSLNLENIASNAHSIKGSAGNLRFNEIYEMAKDMELSAKAGDAGFDYTGHLSAIKSAIATISV